MSEPLVKLRAQRSGLTYSEASKLARSADSPSRGQSNGASVLHYDECIYRNDK